MKSKIFPLMSDQQISNTNIDYFQFWFSPIKSTIEKVAKNSNKKQPAWIDILAEQQIMTWLDLLWMLPSKFLPIEKESEDLPQLHSLVQIKGQITKVSMRPLFFRKRKNAPLLYNAKATLTSNFRTYQLNGFNLYPTVKEKWLQWATLDQITLIGEYDFSSNLHQLNQPYVQDLQELQNPAKISYPKIKGITALQWKKIWDLIPEAAWNFIPGLTPQMSEAFQIIHRPNAETIQKEAWAKKTLAYVELLADQILIQNKILTRKKLIKNPLNINLHDYLANPHLPFQLSPSQVRAITSIHEDFLKPYPMRKLMQGDVGSGKTIVAFICTMMMLDLKKQVMFIAPTEILAQQHWNKWCEFFPDQNKPVLYTATLSAADKRHALENIKNNTSGLVIGTHALLSDKVQFSALELIIIDEQHRFGVEQRKQLYLKGAHPHVLMMTATPIPRTLSLTTLGDVDKIILEQDIFKDKKISTKIVSLDQFQLYLSFIKTRLEMKEQIYIVVPVIESSDHLAFDLKTVTSFYQTHFSAYGISILHGQLSHEAKEESLRLFQQGVHKIMIATTMIEVGIDIAASSTISIYHPEMFGLSTLHQLRGRVGRKGRPAFCFLLNLTTLNEQQQNRLNFFKECDQGDRLAAYDADQRGLGDVWGKDQSGIKQRFKIAQLNNSEENLDLLHQAHLEACKFLQDKDFSQQELYHCDFYPIIPQHLRPRDLSFEHSWL